ncbi:MAG: 4-hydroxy-tetrahydrodipicolinate synthase [Thermonemataceae bacterium]
MRFSGIGAALVTPFDEHLQIDFEGYRRLLSHTLTIGVDYWVIQGTTGESPTVSKEEKSKLLRFSIENNPQQVPIVYGIGGNHTEGVLATIQQTDLSQVDALLSANPYYNKPSQEGIYQHYLRIAEASPVPIILYNVPGRTASNIHAETTLRLAEHPNIIAIKEASGSLPQCMEIACHKPAGFQLLSGDDLLTTSMISFGAEGVISVMANAFKAFNDMVHQALEGNFEVASQLLYKLLDINTLMYTESNPVGLKEALNQFKVCANYVRLPLLPATEQLKQQIEQVIVKDGLQP